MTQIQDINRLNDVFFKSLLGDIKHKNLTLNFINSILDRDEQNQFVDLKLLDKEVLPPVKDVKVPIVDILAVVNDGTYVNIELQVAKQLFYIKRSLYYWSRLYGYQLKSGEHYRKPTQTITINLLNFDLLPYTEYHNSYHLTNDRNKDRLTDEMEIHYIELKKFKFSDYKDLKKKQADSWIAYFSPRCTNEQREVIAMENPIIKDALNFESAFSQDTKQWRKYELEEKALKDYNSTLADSREEGIHVGIQKGIQIGEQKGRAEGIQITAKNMLKLGVSTAIVSQATGLSIEQIEDLKKQL